MSFKDLLLGTAAVALTAVSLYGSIELANRSHKEFCTKYGWLKNQPVSVQMEYAEKAPFNRMTKKNYTKYWLKDLESCGTCE